METGITQMESTLVGRLLFQPQEFSLLLTMIKIGLWHEPHSLMEIADQAARASSHRLVSRNDLKREIVAVLKKSMVAGLISRESGFFFLTANGRVEMGSRFGMNDDRL
jgi:hypothetical protein